MHNFTLTLTGLRDCLAQVEPVKLLGMELLKQGSTRSQAHAFPTGIARNQMVAAVTELIGYTRRCAYAARQVGSLTSVPLVSVPIVEFAL